jgi:hypothetical protein
MVAFSMHAQPLAGWPDDPQVVLRTLATQPHARALPEHHLDDMFSTFSAVFPRGSDEAACFRALGPAEQGAVRQSLVDAFQRHFAADAQGMAGTTSADLGVGIVTVHGAAGVPLRKRMREERALPSGQVRLPGHAGPVNVLIVEGPGGLPATNVKVVVSNLLPMYMVRGLGEALLSCAGIPASQAHVAFEQLGTSPDKLGLPCFDTAVIHFWAEPATPGLSRLPSSFYLGERTVQLRRYSNQATHAFEPPGAAPQQDDRMQVDDAQAQAQAAALTQALAQVAELKQANAVAQAQAAAHAAAQAS